MKKRKIKLNKFALIVIILFICAILFLYLILAKQTKKEGIITAKIKPTIDPTLVPPIITDINETTKKVIFPSYRLSFQIPSKFIQKDSLYQWYGQKINYIVMYKSSDYKVKFPSGDAISGVFGVVTVSKGWDGFSDELTQNAKDKQTLLAQIDNSILPTTNLIITHETTRAYGTGQVEVKLNTRSVLGYYEGFRMSCWDYSSNRCLEIVRTILSTLEIEK